MQADSKKGGSEQQAERGGSSEGPLGSHLMTDQDIMNCIRAEKMWRKVSRRAAQGALPCIFRCSGVPLARAWKGLGFCCVWKEEGESVETGRCTASVGHSIFGHCGEFCGRYSVVSEE